jgi:hypothetical protein
MQLSRQNRHVQHGDQNAVYMLTGRDRLRYEKWKTERDIIDGERMNRQLGETGHWAREWDRGKGGSSQKLESSHQPYVTTPIDRPGSEHTLPQQASPLSPSLANTTVLNSRVEFASGRGRARCQASNVRHSLPNLEDRLLGKQEIVSGRGRGRKAKSIVTLNPGIASRHAKDEDNARPERLVSRSDSFEAAFSSGYLNWADLPTPTSDNDPSTFSRW